MKKTFYLFVFSLLVSLAPIQAQNWSQIGVDIDGEAAGDYSGRSVSLSSDGSIVAIGAYANDGNGPNSGHVRIFQNISGTWTQIGQDIDGEIADEWFGISVSLSSDGSIIAIGACEYLPNSTDAGHVRIYKNISGTWTQIGADIDGEAAGDRSGKSVSLSSDGSIVAIGAPYNDGNGNRLGHVRIYQNIDGTWMQIGEDIDGEATSDISGTSVSLSSDGSIVAIGAPSEYGYGYYAGHVRIYQNNSGTWTKIKQFSGRINDDCFGYSVSLSSDGATVAIGAPGDYLSGRVCVFQKISGTWTQIGQDFDGEMMSDTGESVSLSSDGSIVAIGAPGYPENDACGTVRIYQINILGTWTQIGADIDGENAWDKSGCSVSLSSDGSKVAIGAMRNDGNGTNSGHVRVYNNDSLKISELEELGILIYPNPSTGVFTIENAEAYEIKITDSTGKIVYHTKNTTDGRVHIETSGIYLINFISKTKNFSSKIIVE